MPNDLSMWADIERAISYRKYIEGDVPDLRAWDIAVRMASSIGLVPTTRDAFILQDQRTQVTIRR